MGICLSPSLQFPSLASFTVNCKLQDEINVRQPPIHYWSHSIFIEIKERSKLIKPFFEMIRNGCQGEGKKIVKVRGREWLLGHSIFRLQQGDYAYELTVLWAHALNCTISSQTKSPFSGRSCATSSILTRGSTDNLYLLEKGESIFFKGKSPHCSTLLQ